MIKKILVAIISVALSFVSLYAEEAGSEKKIGYTVGLDVSSNYIWRGIDVFSTKLDAEGKQSSLFNFGPALFPTITFNVENTGLSFNIWSSFALGGRTAATGGLGNADEIDLTASYTVEDKSGAFTGSLIGYVYPTGPALLASYPEILFSYTAPVILSPKIGMAAAMGNAGGSTEYLFVGIGHTFEFDKLSIAPGLNFGYWLYNAGTKTNKAHLDVVIPVSYAITDSFEVHASFTGSYRISGFDTAYAPFIMAAAVGASVSF